MSGLWKLEGHDYRVYRCLRLMIHGMGIGLHHAHRAALHGSIVGSQHKSDPTTLPHKDMPELRQMNPLRQYLLRINYSIPRWMHVMLGGEVGGTVKK